MRKHHSSIFLVIVQAWIVPCHGFAYTPHSLGSLGLASSTTARHASFATPLPCPPTAGNRGTLSSLSMSDQEGGAFDPYGEEDQGLPLGAKAGDDSIADTPEPYREEHTSGGSRFRELLARAKGEVKPRPTAPRREPPPQGPPNYDTDEAWEERVIGSPDLPDPPLRNEMPGLQLSPELEYGGQAGPGGPDGGGGGGGGDSRFQRMMSQAQANEKRSAAGVAPRTSPRSQEGKPVPPPMSQAEKDRALRAAVDRQQKLMSKARGIDLDDPSLDGPGLVKKKALSRMQAESSAGGYVPSSSAADDYMAQLKADSRRKLKEQEARMSGREIPADVPGASGAVSGEYDDDFVAKPAPQRRTSSTFSVTNTAHAYIASLKGIKVELPERRAEQAQSPSPRILPPRLPLPPKPPLGPSMSYAEKLKLAKEGKSPGAAAPQAAAAAVPQAAAAPVVPASPAARTPPPTLSYAERLKQAQEAKGGVAAAPAQPASAPAPVGRPPVPKVQASRPSAPVRLMEQEVPESALLGEDVAQAKITRVIGMLAEQETAGVVGEGRAGELRDALVDVKELLRAETEAAAQQPAGLGGDTAQAKMTRVVGMLAEQEAAGVVGAGRAGELRHALVDVREMLRAETEAAASQREEPETAGLGEDAAQTKITRVMDLLTEHKTSGLIGEERVTELRSALLDTREFLRAETYGQPAPSATAPAAGVQKPVPQPQQPAPASADSVETLRRCNALLAVHIHTPLTGVDVEALAEALASSLAIVQAQGGGVTATVSDPEVQEAPRADAGVDVVPAYAGGIQSVGAALTDMGVGNKPEKFEPENNDSGDAKGWLGGSLGDYEKGVASKALGYLLKHRGGKGYGRGRVKGKEAEAMVSTLAEVAEIMEEEMVED